MPAASGVSPTAVTDGDDAPSSKRSKRTPCTNCRQQKARCDAELGSGKPCSRCAKLKAECVVATEFKREMKRRRTHEPTTPTQTTTGLRTTSGLPTPLQSNDDGESRDGPTLARTLDDITLDPTTIDELFDTFFRRYHPFLPIFDPHMLPNAFYARDPFTFFSIVAVAAQKNKPQLSHDLSPSVYNLAMVSPMTKLNYFNSIHAILLLLTWPLSRIPDQDITFPLSATLMHMGLTIGLHIPLSTIEFSRHKLGGLSEADIQHRATLWAQCQIAYARCSICKGVTAFAINQRINNAVIASKVPPELRFHRRLHHIVLRFFEASQEISLKKMDPEQDRSLGVLIGVFEDQLRNVADEQFGEMDKIYVAMSRLQIIIFHFFRSSANVPAQALANIYNTANAIVIGVQRLDSVNQLISVAPFYVAFGVLIAANTLLRICKTVTEPWLDIIEARKHLLDAIDVCKRLSKSPHDICRRCVHRMLQVWNSQRSYHKPDGSPDFEMRAKSRHALTMVLDVLWRYKEEFEDGMDTWNSTQPPGMVEAAAPNGQAAPVDNTGFAVDNFDSSMNDPFLFDFGLDMDFGQEWMPMFTPEGGFG